MSKKFRTWDVLTGTCGGRPKKTRSSRAASAYREKAIGNTSSTAPASSDGDTRGLDRMMHSAVSRIVGGVYTQMTRPEITHFR